MDERQCAKCNSMVDAAKAFCPDCGSPMLAEKQRQTTTEFNVYEGTDRITRSAYRIMMKDMELDISESPPIRENAPAPQTAPAKSSAKIWMIIGGALFAFLAISLLTFAALFFLMR